MAGVFCSFYLLASYKALKCDNEIVRIGAAGSLASIICECSFHFVDTVNIRAKASSSEIGNSTFRVGRDIWVKEGI